MACYPGHYCPAGASAPLPCVGGTYSNAIDLARAADCTGASPGYYAPTGSEQQIACPTGSIALAVNATECDPCTAGSYQDATAATACKTCEPGSYCPPGASAALPCAAGSYSSATNLVSASECSPTEPGYYAPTGSTMQIECAAGTVAVTGGLPACETCVQGKFVDTTGQTACIECSICSRTQGEYSIAPCIPQMDNICAYCQNEQCAFGSYRIGNECGGYNCVACEPGFYCPGGIDRYAAP